MTPCIYAQENKQEECKAPQRRTAIGEERQWNADNRRQAQHHTHIDEYMEQEYGQHTIAIYPSEG